MRFVGRPEGKLMKGAPGNYRQNEIYLQPFRMSRFAFWKLIDPPPELKVPEAKTEDSVFEENIFVPTDVKEDEEKVVDLPPVELKPISNALPETVAFTINVPEPSKEEDADLPEIIDLSNIGVPVKRRGRKRVEPKE